MTAACCAKCGTPTTKVGWCDGPCAGPAKCVTTRLTDGTIHNGPPIAGGNLAGELDPCPEDPNDNVGNVPVTVEEYRCSLAVQLQPVLDAARRINHDLGLRPYRVALVWEERDRDQIYREFKRIELFPVKIANLNDIDLVLSAVGLDGDGAIKLTKISPVQVTHDDLRGWLDGVSLDAANSPDDRRFFYEVTRIQRCDGDLQEVRGRFTIAGVPFLNGKKFQWEVLVMDQNQQRGVQGEDRTFKPDDKIPDIGGKVARLRR